MSPGSASSTWQYGQCTYGILVSGMESGHSNDTLLERNCDIQITQLLEWDGGVQMDYIISSMYKETACRS